MSNLLKENLLISPRPAMKTMQGQTSEPEDSGAATISAHFLMSSLLTQARNPTDGHPSSHASGMRQMPGNKKMAWLIYALGLLHHRQNGNLASTFYKRLASLLSEKRREAYSSTLGWIRTHLSFSLDRSAIMYIQGA